MEILKSNSETATKIVVGISALYGVYKLKEFVRSVREKRRIIDRRKNRLIVITGCDTGLGLTMAKWALDVGYNVLAGCLNDSGDGPQRLMSSNNNDDSGIGGCPFIQTLDVTKKESIDTFAIRCEELLTEHNLELYALIANAAVAIPGEFFWTTEEQDKHQMNVNFWGVTTLADIFQNQLLENKSRLIVISSDCANFPLPGIGIYAATKAALQNWATALRLEVSKFGMSVVSFQPGSFALQTRIMCCQEKNIQLMEQKIAQNDTIEFHGRNLEAFIKHWEQFDKNPETGSLAVDHGIKKAFFTVLENDISKTPVFIHESWSHYIFHLLMNWLPTSMADAMILKVLNAPPFSKDTVDQHKNGQ